MATQHQSADQDAVGNDGNDDALAVVCRLERCSMLVSLLHGLSSRLVVCITSGRLPKTTRLTPKAEWSDSM